MFHRAAHHKGWGDNIFGTIGDGTEGYEPRLTPTTISIPMDEDDYPVKLHCESQHCCTETNNGSVFCHGVNYDGRFGNGVLGSNELSPVPVIQNGNFVALDN